MVPYRFNAVVTWKRREQGLKLYCDEKQAVQKIGDLYTQRAIFFVHRAYQYSHCKARDRRNFQFLNRINRRIVNLTRVCSYRIKCILRQIMVFTEVDNMASYSTYSTGKPKIFYPKKVRPLTHRIYISTSHIRKIHKKRYFALSTSTFEKKYFIYILKLYLQELYG